MQNIAKYLYFMANLFNFSVKMIINIDFPFTITISRTLPGSVYEIYLNHLVWVFRHQMYNTKIQRLYSRYRGSCCPKIMLWFSLVFFLTFISSSYITQLLLGVKETPPSVYQQRFLICQFEEQSCRRKFLEWRRHEKY